ncbi:high affinity copper uptake protein 1-like [Rhagoletis pomonella]|uniref:high affinity copper uptake protein 1-like n=1 Tax=Rhagoletis pomonella TaxID=28610 RepID=UPI00178127CE|nr:high affinity copper uptake protein 1-like [Rhagoletis pomonella]
MTADYIHNGQLGRLHYNGACPMLMVFHGGSCERIFWHGWIVNDVIEFVFSALALFVLAFSYEALKFFSQQLVKKNEMKEAHGAEMSTTIKSNCSEAPLTGPNRIVNWRAINTSAHMVQTLLYAAQVTISYVLMLVFMNFNYWICLAVISGLSLGFFAFGWMRRIHFFNECCN